MRKLWLFIITFAYSGLSFAEDRSLYEPWDADAGIYILFKIFGNVFESKNSIVSQLIVMIADMLLIIVLLFLIYGIVVGIINLAVSGQFMSGNQSGTLYAIRMVLGLTMLMKPVGSSLPLINIIVLKLVMTGSYVGDNVWAKVIAFSGSNLFNATVTVSTDEGKYFTDNQDSISKLVAGLTCVYYVNKTLYKVPDNAKFDAFSDYNSGEKLKYAQSLGNQILGVYSLPDDPANPSSDHYHVVFGKPEGDAVSNSQVGCLYIGKMKKSQADAIVSFVEKFNDSAKAAALKAAASNGTNIDTKEMQKYTGTEEFYKALKALVDNYNAFGGTSGSGSGDPPVDTDKASVKYGWIFAGMYYREITSGGAKPQDNGTISSNTTLSIQPVVKTPAVPETVNGNWSTSMNGEVVSDMTSAMGNAAKNYGSSASGSGVDTNPIEELHKGNEKLAATAEELAVFTLSAPVMAAGASKMYTVIHSMQKPNEKLFQAQIDNGKSMVQSAISQFWAIFGITMGLSMAASIMDCTVSAGHAVRGFNNSINGALAAAASVLLVQGSLLAMFIPVIPSFVYLVAVLGWILTVMEGMVAAPVVAIGFLWPGQAHEIFGKAEAAIMLYLSIVMRPVLTVIGFVISLFVCLYSMQLLTLFIGYAVDPAHDLAKLDKGLAWMPLGVMYIGLLIMIVQKSFTLTTAIPDKVLNWIGGQAVSYGGADELLNKAKQGMTEGASKASDTAQKGAESGGKVGGAAVETGAAVGKAAAKASGGA